MIFDSFANSVILTRPKHDFNVFVRKMEGKDLTQIYRINKKLESRDF